MTILDYSKETNTNVNSIIDYMQSDRVKNFFSKHTKGGEDYSENTVIDKHAEIALNEAKSKEKIKENEFINIPEDTTVSAQTEGIKKEDIKEEKKEKVKRKRKIIEKNEEIKENEVKDTPKKRRGRSKKVINSFITIGSIEDSKDKISPQKARLCIQRVVKTADLALMSDHEVYATLSKNYVIVTIGSETMLTDKQIAKELEKKIILL